MNKESLSALFDGQCKGAELDLLLAELEREPALRSAWSRLCVGREAVHGKARRHDEALTRNIMAAIVRDEKPARRLPSVPTWSWLRPVSAYALAAGIGALAMLTLLPGSKDEGTTTIAQADVAMNPYLIDHSNIRAQHVGGSLGYARYTAQRVSNPPRGDY